MAEEVLLNYALSKDEISWHEKDQEIICRLDIQPGEEYRNQHKVVPCDICLVLDSSGSMNENFGQGLKITKRQGVMRAAKGILQWLNPKDTLSLIFYDSRAYTIFSLQNSGNRQSMENKINTLNDYSGGTNFEAALTRARNVLNQGSNLSKRIIFLTDGNANQGNKKTVQKTINEFAGNNVTLDCLGVGSDFNFNYMRGFSQPSNGTTHLLSSPEEADKSFEQLLVTAQRAIATNVFLTAHFEAGLRDIEAYQWHPEMRFYTNLSQTQGGKQRLEINVQNLQQDRRNIYLFKANMDPAPDEPTKLLARIRLDYDLPPAGKTGLSLQTNIRVNQTDGSTPSITDSDVESSFFEVELSKFYEQVIQIMNKDWQQAAGLIKEMIKRCDKLGDNRRKTHYENLKQKLLNTHNLTQEDLNNLGSDSTHSEQQTESFLDAANTEFDINY